MPRVYRPFTYNTRGAPRRKCSLLYLAYGTAMPSARDPLSLTPCSVRLAVHYRPRDRRDARCHRIRHPPGTHPLTHNP